MKPATRALFNGPNFAHVATIMADGSPHVVPVWVEVEADRVLFHKERSSVACGNLTRDPRIAISIIDGDSPYRFAWLRGRAVGFRDDPYAAQWLDQAAVRYTGKPYPPEHFQQLGPGTVIIVEPDRDAAAHISFLHHHPTSNLAQ